MSHTEIKSLLIDYVNRNSNVYNLEWDPRLSEKLLFNPFGKSYEEKNRPLFPSRGLDNGNGTHREG